MKMVRTRYFTLEEAFERMFQDDKSDEIDTYVILIETVEASDEEECNYDCFNNDTGVSQRDTVDEIETRVKKFKFSKCSGNRFLSLPPEDI